MPRKEKQRSPRLVRDQEAGGSSPLTPTIQRRGFECTGRVGLCTIHPINAPLTPPVCCFIRADLLARTAGSCQRPRPRSTPCRQSHIYPQRIGMCRFRSCRHTAVRSGNIQVCILSLARLLSCPVEGIRVFVAIIQVYRTTYRITIGL